MKFSTLASLAALAPSALAQTLKGFNYGSVNTDNSPITQQQYTTLFNDAKNLAGTSGFTAARLFTTVQGGSQSGTDPTSAIPAAISTGTKLLLGLYVSGGQGELNQELTALSNAVSQYGTAFTDLVVGISVGSEDLYRNSPTGIENGSNPGLNPDTLVDFINTARQNIQKYPNLASKPILHVDTYTAYINESNAAVVSAVDVVGTDAYPYFQFQVSNPIGNAADLFFSAYNQTVSFAQGKPVWITETGWPVSGATVGQAVPSTENARTYWDAVACRVFGQINTFWYTLQDNFPGPVNGPSFGVIGSQGGTTPLYDLSCPAGSSGASSGVTGGSSGSSGAGSSGSGSKSATTPNSVYGGSSPTSGSSGSGSSGSSSGSSGSGSGTGSGSGSGAQGGAVTSTLSVYTTVCPTVVNGKTTQVTSAVTSPVEGGSGSVSTANTPQSAASQTPAPAPSASPSSSGGKSCPADLSGTYEYPHLIVPIDSSQPDKASGTSYNGTISSTESSLFLFDIPASDEGKTCSLVFMLPTQSELETSSFTLSGTGGIDVAALESPPQSSTSYSSCPKSSQDLGGPTSVTPGNNYVIASGPCAAGKSIGYKMSSTGISLNYFQDYNPSPIGMYVTVC